MPGTARLALVGGGTIPDTGQYPVYLGDGGPRLGELDEEFVLERRVGETFVLGTSTWRIDAIEPHRVVVAPGRGAVRRDALLARRGRAADGRAGRGGRRSSAASSPGGSTTRRCSPGSATSAGSTPTAAQVLRDYVARQLRVAGAVPDDRTVLDRDVPRPGRRDSAWPCSRRSAASSTWRLKLALQARLRERLGITVACLHGDDGLLFRLPQTDEPPLDLFDGLTAELAEALIREELGDSALFGLRFRQNAGRALLMPRPDPAKRTPLWLQRLRAKDLLQVVRKFPDFPIVVETYRECLDDDLDLPALRAFLDAIERARSGSSRGGARSPRRSPRT